MTTSLKNVIEADRIGMTKDQIAKEDAKAAILILQQVRLSLKLLAVNFIMLYLLLYLNIL